MIADLYSHMRGFENGIKISKSSQEEHNDSLFPSFKELFGKKEDLGEMSYST